MFRFSPMCETTKKPKLVRESVSKSLVLVPKFRSTKTTPVPLGRCKLALMSVENKLFTKKLARVNRDDCANQGSESELTRDINDGASQSYPNALSFPEHKRQSGLRWMMISTVRPAPHLSTSCNTPCEKNADRTAPVSACVRRCSAAKSSATTTNSKPMTEVE